MSCGMNDGLGQQTAAPTASGCRPSGRFRTRNGMSGRISAVWDVLGTGFGVVGGNAGLALWPGLTELVS